MLTHQYLTQVALSVCACHIKQSYVFVCSQFACVSNPAVGCCPGPPLTTYRQLRTSTTKSACCLYSSDQAWLCTLHIIAGLTSIHNLHYDVCLQVGQIVDDELNNWLVNPLPQGVILHCVIDACHSGSVMDLPYRSKIKYGKPVWKNEYTVPTKKWKVCTPNWDACVFHK